MNAKPETVPCSRCAKYDVPAPDSIEEDPLCPGCIRVLMFEAADNVFGKMHDQELAAGHVELAHDLDPIDWHHNHDPRMMGV